MFYLVFFFGFFFREFKIGFSQPNKQIIQPVVKGSQKKKGPFCRKIAVSVTVFQDVNFLSDTSESLGATTRSLVERCYLVL